MKKGIFIIIFLLAGRLILAQTNEFAAIDSIQLFSKNLYDNSPDTLKKAMNQKVEQLLGEFLLMEQSVFFSFDSLRFLKSLPSGDGSFKIFTWAVPLMGDAFLYSGFVQVFGKGGSIKQVIKLENLPVETDLLKSYNSNNWPGAVYYKIIGLNYGKTKLYTLFGWQGSKPGMASRIIETLIFDENGTPVFGTPVFSDYSSKKLCRVIFKFTDKVPFQLSYEKQLIPGSKKKRQNMIVFNRLISAQPDMGLSPGVKMPDYGTFDGFVFKKDSWHFMKDIDVRMPEQKSKSTNSPNELNLAPSTKKK